MWALDCNGAFIVAVSTMLISYFLARYEISCIPQELRQDSFNYFLPQSMSIITIFTYNICKNLGLLTCNDFDRLLIPTIAITLLLVIVISVTIFTDRQTFLISRRYTLFFVPIGWILAQMNLLSISSLQSISGALFGIMLMWSINHIGKYFKKQDVLGQGDVDFIALIGAFTGVRGCWFAILFGSWFGTFLIITLLIGNFFAKNSKTNKFQYPKKIPFGSYLGFGALIYILMITTPNQTWIGQFFCRDFPYLN